MFARALHAILAWGIAGHSSAHDDDSPRVLLWTDGDTADAELPRTIDPRFVRADGDAFSDELSDARAAAEDGTRARLRGIEEVLARAREDYVAQRWDAMSSTLAALERDALALLADPRRCDTLWELEFRRALAARGRGDVDEARRRNMLALALDPDRRPPREVYGPELAADFLDAVDDVAARVAVPVRVAATPADAVLHVDCAPHGGGRVDLRPGLHVLHAHALGHAPSAVIFEVPRDHQVELALDPWPIPDAATRLGHGLAAEPLALALPSHRRALVAAAAARGIDVVVAVEFVGEQVRARALVGAARGPLLVRSTAAAAVDAVLRGVADDGTLRAAPSPRPPVAAATPIAERTPIVRAWWLWTTIAVVVATGLGLGLGLGLREPQSDRLIIYGPRGSSGLR